MRTMKNLVRGERPPGVRHIRSHLDTLDHRSWDGRDANRLAKSLPVAQIPRVFSVHLIELPNKGQPNGPELILILAAAPLTGASQCGELYHCLLCRVEGNVVSLEERDEKDVLSESSVWSDLLQTRSKWHE
jgi:hypothetical protein